MPDPAPLVSLDEAKKHLKMEGSNDDDALIQIYLDAAISKVDGPDGDLGRSISRQSITAKFDNLGGVQSLKLRWPPIISVTSVSYLDANRNSVDVDPSSYELVGRTLQAIGTPAWSGGAARGEAITVVYEAGYETPPARVKSAILLMTGDLYRSRETFVIGPTSAIEVPMSLSVCLLLQGLQVYD